MRIPRTPYRVRTAISRPAVRYAYRVHGGCVPVRVRRTSYFQLTVRRYRRRPARGCGSAAPREVRRYFRRIALGRFSGAGSGTFIVLRESRHRGQLLQYRFTPISCQSLLPFYRKPLTANTQFFHRRRRAARAAASHTCVSLCDLGPGNPRPPPMVPPHGPTGDRPPHLLLHAPTFTLHLASTFKGADTTPQSASSSSTRPRNTVRNSV